MRRERYPVFNLKGQSTSSAREGFDLRRALGLLQIVLILLAPSIWLLATIPPLWRDADAYHQLLFSPARATLEGHGMLYGMVARIPLYLGAWFEGVLPNESFFNHARLTDTGILLLIAGQHLALCVGAFALVITATQSLWCRIFLALFFAGNSIFYTLAHCVGSETLSLLCTLALTVAGLRLLKWPLHFRGWIFFALALLACILTRYANLFLLLPLPLALLLLAAQRRSLNPLRHAAIAFVIGLLCLGTARLAVGAVCASTGPPYYPRGGFTFLWRLNFLESIPEPRRSELLDEVNARTKSGHAREIISTLREMLENGEPLSPIPIYQKLRAALSTPDQISTRRFHLALNATARAFLYPPTPEHWRAAEHDFATALQMPMSVVSTTFFVTTVFCFEHREDLPELMTLSTFRNYTSGDLMTIATSRLYFTGGKNLSLGSVMIVWGIIAIVTIFAGRTGTDVTPILFFGLALVITAVLILQATALLIDLAPRYTLPLWEMLWLASMIYLGAIADALVRRNEKTAGQQQLG